MYLISGEKIQHYPGAGQELSGGTLVDFLTLKESNSDPTEYSEGSMWLRADLGEVRIFLAGQIRKFNLT